jgi:catalase
MSDRGTPQSYRHMNGYSSHTLRFIAADNTSYWVKLHYKTDAGIKTFTDAQAGAMKSSDADHATRDLFDHIEGGQAATWNMYIQVCVCHDMAHNSMLHIIAMVRTMA